MRRLRFPSVDGKVDKDRDCAARAVLAAMGLFALARQNEIGYDLRSRCCLKAPTKPRFEFVRNAASDERFEIDSPKRAQDIGGGHRKIGKIPACLGMPANAFYPNEHLQKILMNQAESEKNDAGD